MERHLSEKILFTEEECNKILKYCTDLTQTNWSVQLEGKYNEIGCSLKYQDLYEYYNDDTKWFFDRVVEWSKSLLDIEYINPPHGGFRSYEKGDYFIRHKDNVSNGDGKKRYFTMSIQLSNSDDYKGGNIVVENSRLDTRKTISREIGNTVLWGSDLVHQITELTSGERKSLVFFTDASNVKINKSLL